MTETIEVMVGVIVQANRSFVRSGKTYSTTNATSRNGITNSDKSRVDASTRSSRGCSAVVIESLVPFAARKSQWIATVGRRWFGRRETRAAWIELIAATRWNTPHAV